MTEAREKTRPDSLVGVVRNLVVIALVAAAVAWALSVGGHESAGVPTVWWCALAAFAVQWIAFVPAYLRQTEHYYDLTGSITYLTVSVAALLLVEVFDLRSILIVVLVWIWALRLGTFLFRRVKKAGKDGRFDKIKTSAPMFFQAWTLQGLWVFLTLAAGLAAVTAPRPDLGLGVWEIAGLVVWTAGFLIEAIADYQKSQFKQDPANDGDFIDSGLWSWSRHPNYFGEITLWIGVALIATPTLEGWRWVAWISPVFVTFLLTRISGVTMLERRADKKWGGDPEYERYKERTSVLVPLPPGK